MSHLAAALLLVMPSPRAWTCMVNLLDAHHFHDFYSMDLGAIGVHSHVFGELLQQFMPEVSSKVFVMPGGGGVGVGGRGAIGGSAVKCIGVLGNRLSCSLLFQMARKLLQQGLDCRIFILEWGVLGGASSCVSPPVTRRRWWMTVFLSALNIDMGFRWHSFANGTTFASHCCCGFARAVLVTLSRAFDLFLLDGVPALFRIGLALLQVHHASPHCSPLQPMSVFQFIHLSSHISPPPL
jgi:hypothetical protein